MAITGSQWLNLESAVLYLANKDLNIPQLLEFGRLDELPMYALVDRSFTIQFWDMKMNPPLLKKQEITNFLQVSPDQIQKIQKLYPASGLSISVEALLPPGCSYDLSDLHPIHMRMETKHLARGVTIDSHEDIRVLRRELDIFKAKKEDLQRAKRSAMSKPINDIRKLSDEPNNKMVIWEALKALALTKNPPPPIVGYTDEGIQYRGVKFDESGEPDVYTKKAFRSHMDRNPYS
jgi:hypothetical protein